MGASGQRCHVSHHLATGSIFGLMGRFGRYHANETYWPRLEGETYPSHESRCNGQPAIRKRHGRLRHLDAARRQLSGAAYGWTTVQEREPNGEGAGETVLIVVSQRDFLGQISIGHIVSLDVIEIFPEFRRVVAIGALPASVSIAAIKRETGSE